MALQYYAMALLILSTPFIYTMMRWMMFIIDGLLCMLFSTVNARVNLDSMISYKYLKRTGRIPATAANDYDYASGLIIRFGLFGFVSVFGVLGLFTPEMVYT